MKLLIIRAGALGDTLMLLPSIAQIQNNADILFVGREPSLSILRPYVHQTIDFERGEWHGLFQDSAAKKPNVPPVDRIAAFVGDREGRIASNLKAWFQNAHVNVFPPLPPKDANLHAASHMAQCLQKTGLPIDEEESMNNACKRALLNKKSSTAKWPNVILHPGSGSRGKTHPPEFWLDMIPVLNNLQKNAEHPIGVLLGPAEEPLFPVFEDKQDGRTVRLIITPDTEDLLSCLSSARLYLGHDSGVTHLAAMLGVPTIALFKNSDIHQWKPLGPRVKVFEDIEGSPKLRDKILDWSSILLRQDKHD